MMHIKNKLFLLRLLGFILTLILLIVYFKSMTNKATMDNAMAKTEMMLMTNRAITDFVSQEQKTSVAQLQDIGEIEKDYFNPKLQSGSYITKRIHYYYNKEQKRLGKPTHEFKFSSNNPLNQENMANAFEKDILEKMNSGEINEVKQLVKKDGKTYLYYALALKENNKSCMKCHSTPEEAPASLVEHYGTKSGFNYKLGEIVGMNSIYTPVDEDIKQGNELFIYLIGLTVFILIGVFFLTEFMFLQLGKKRIAEKQNKALEGELEYQNEALQKSLKIISQHIMLSKTDLDGNITEVSEALCGISGYTMDEMIGKPHSIVRHPDTEDSVFADMWQRIKNGETWQGELKNRHKDGSHFWVDIIVTPDFNENGTIIGYSSFWHDASHKKRMELMSITDTLTQLYNRRHFSNIFDEERARAKRDGKMFAFLMMDLDFFKRYNDTYGHQAGDEVLRSTAHVMKTTFKRGGDFCFRLGGEEFGIFYSAEDADHCEKLALKLCKNIEDMKIDHKHNKASDYVTTSVGLVVLNPDKELDMEKMVSLSDDELYIAKDNGRNQVSKIII